MRPYASGLIVGRFQVFHSGHERVFRTALKLCGRVLVLVGSSQESRTEKNPLSYDERVSMLTAVFPRESRSGRLIVAPLPDIGVGNVPAWGAYVLRAAVKSLGSVPELLVSGREERRVSWFDDCGEDISELYVPKTIDISATAMREWLCEGDEESWKRYCPRALHKSFGAMREAMLASEGNGRTASL